MNIVILQGSPRTDGNTEALLQPVVAAARNAGARVEIVRLAQYRNLTGCEECRVCKSDGDDVPDDEWTCAIDDDMQEVYEKVRAADTIVWATPVFCWSPSWLLKMAMDRLYCLCDFRPDGHFVSGLKGRQMAAVITSGGNPATEGDLTLEALRRLAAFFQCEWVGELAAGGLADPAAYRASADVQTRATAFGHTLAAHAASTEAETGDENNGETEADDETDVDDDREIDI